MGWYHPRDAVVGEATEVIFASLPLARPLNLDSHLSDPATFDHCAGKIQPRHGRRRSQPFVPPSTSTTNGKSCPQWSNVAVLHGRSPEFAGGPPHEAGHPDE